MTRLSINWHFILGFIALSFVLAEMHELVHTNVGYVLGGCYGERDFNVWALCDTAKANPYWYLATLSGPIFTFIMVWVGYLMMKRAGDVGGRALGLAVLFASMPFGRIMTVLMKAGDEFMVMRHLFGNDDNYNLLWLLTSAIIIGICIIPLLGAYKALPERRRWLSFLALFLGPTVALIVILLLGLNPLLIGGMLAGPALLGQPLFITLWFLLCLGVTYWKRDYLKTWLIED